MPYLLAQQPLKADGAAIDGSRCRHRRLALAVASPTAGGGIQGRPR